jgi:AraC-like DNA-binding protein
MRPAASVEQFVGDPLRRYFAGSGFLVWCGAPDLCGTVLWGRPGDSAIRCMVRLWEFDRRLARYDVVTDAARLEGIDPEGFKVLLDYVQARMEDYNTRVNRVAIVYPGGVDGASVAGFTPLVGPRYDWRVFGEARQGFGWLAHPAGEELHAEVNALVLSLMGLPPSLWRLRQHLALSLTTATVARAAQALSVSVRTLQRDLHGAGTSFRDELARARLDAARRLLGETDLKLDEIARKVGLSSNAHLAALCRRLDGRSPKDIRAAAGR